MSRADTERCCARCCDGDDRCACGGTIVHVGYGPMCDECGCDGSDPECDVCEQVAS